MSLRDDWKAWHRWLGMRLTAIGIALGMLGQAWPMFPSAWTDALPHWASTALGWAAIASVVTGFGRRFLPNNGNPPGGNSQG